MTTKVQLDEMEVTRAERLLAVILAVFALIGGLWVYSKLDEIARPLPPAFVEPTPQQARAISAGERAEAVLAREEEDRAAARDELELRREAYRTALDPGGAPVALERDYRQAQADFQEADRRVRRAGAAAGTTRGPAEVARDEVEAAQRRQGEDFEQRLDRHGLITFLVRFVYVLAVLGIAYWWLARLRRRHTRLFPIGIAVAGAAAVQVVVMSFDYGTDYFDLLDLGPLVLSLVGIAMTTVAFVALQR